MKRKFSLTPQLSYDKNSRKPADRHQQRLLSNFMGKTEEEDNDCFDAQGHSIRSVKLQINSIFDNLLLAAPPLLTDLTKRVSKL